MCLIKNKIYEFTYYMNATVNMYIKLQRFGDILFETLNTYLHQIIIKVLNFDSLKF